MAPQDEPRGIGCAGRLGLLLVAWVASTLVVFLALPEKLVAEGLAAQFDAARFDLNDPALLHDWRWAIASFAGLVVVAALVLVIGWSWLRHRRQLARSVPEVLRRLRRAVQRRDAAEVGRAADEIGASLGGEAVPDLLQALDANFNDDTRRKVAAALYRLGRAVTAEVELMPR